ncbi:MAG: phosphatase PAP2 family protein [Alphaproteobacteria bacterium]|nr:phosphatase PAP2 family protein [Alphaproteobacteria bacterium]MBU6472348.1 phosphatase PAP2 family protein [Alphaproteobacteria bacterium]MDE2012105.1 phosphatase PAP2 family protein [Alphaproteobacteria bacterium]MDE2072317.1 phosphatase PAP2 family protein [Alphaproteobacteria bacterium]MDE2350588.1 phosphatase PAP2 family protein [Alphaproteobacteria bacterium]
MKQPFSGLGIWLVSLLVCAVTVGLAFLFVDMPVARAVYPFSGSLGALGAGLGSAVLLTLEALVVLILALIRLTRGRLSPFGEALAIACLSSICAYAIDSNVLKICLGVPNPSAVFGGAQHGFNFLKGAHSSSFPSGHMVLAAAFCGVFMRLYRSAIRPLSALLCVAAVLLVLGNWHFVSDVIAGTFIGVSVGLLAGQVWRVHAGRNGARGRN